VLGFPLVLAGARARLAGHHTAALVVAQMIDEHPRAGAVVRLRVTVVAHFHHLPARLWAGHAPARLLVDVHDESSPLAVIVLAYPNSVNPAARPDPADGRDQQVRAARQLACSGIGGSGLTPPEHTKSWPGQRTHATIALGVQEG